MSLHFWIFGVFFVAVVGISEAQTDRGRIIAEYESAICEPRKKHLDVDGCVRCICRPNGYGSVCEPSYCRSRYRRPVEERECTPYRKFSTRCHFCNCSAAGIPIGCVEKRRRCMDDFLEDLEEERFNGRPEIVEPVVQDPF